MLFSLFSNVVEDYYEADNRCVGIFWTLDLSFYFFFLFKPNFDFYDHLEFLFFFFFKVF